MTLQRWCCALILLVWSSWTPATAADPVREGLKLLPPDAAITFTLHNLGQHGEQISHSPFAQWFGSTAFGQALLDRPELAGFAALPPFLQSQFEITLLQLRDEILGDFVAFSYVPGEGATPEHSLLLVVPKNVEFCQQLLTKLHAIQQQNGEVLKLVPKEHQKRKYVERQKRRDGDIAAADYFSLESGILLYTSDESAMKAALERLDAPGKPAESPLLAEWDRFGIDRPFVWMALNPQNVSRELQARLKQPLPRQEQAFLEHFAKLWQGTEFVGLALFPGQPVEVKLQVRVNESRWPPAFQKLLSASETRPAWTTPPKTAFLHLQGQFPAEPWLEALAGFTPQGEHPIKYLQEYLGPVIGKDRLPLVLKQLGPNWCFWAEPPRVELGHCLPEWTLAVQLGTTPPKPEVQRGLGLLLDYSAHQLRLQHNKDHADQIDFVDELLNGQRVKWLTAEKAFPVGLRPAYGFRDGVLVLGSRPERVATFQLQPSQQPQPLLRFSGEKFQAYLRSARQPLAEELARTQGRKPEELRREIDQLLNLAELVRTVEWTHSATSRSQQEWSLKLTLAKSLRKE